MENQRNVLLAIVLSAAILFGFNFLFDSGKPAVQQQAAPQAVQTPTPTVQAPGQDAVMPSIPGGPQTVQEIKQTRAALLSNIDRVKISTPRLKGSISLQGARFDDLTLTDYNQTLGDSENKVVLLNPKGTPGAYFAEFGWTGQGLVLPTAETVWSASSTELTPEKPVILSWDNGQGLVFERTVEVDKDYLFTIKQRVFNNSDKSVDLFPYGLISRTDKPQVSGFYILHEGPIGVYDGSLKEEKYDDLIKEPVKKFSSTGGWLGFTDKYWLTALIPSATEVNQGRFSHHRSGEHDKFQTDYLNAQRTVAAGASVEVVDHFFAGAKELTVLKKYENELGVEKFNLAIDFGWFFFITKPFFTLMHWLYGVIGNFGISILVFTIMVKAALFPLANKSYTSMSKMKLLQPKVKDLQDRFKDDKQRLNQEMMALYKREKVNPASGCLPIFIQIPIFFSLYKVLFVTIEMRHAPFFGWIQDLSAPDPTSVFNLFGLIPWTPPHFLAIGIWPLIMGITMFLQQRLNPQPADPVQAKIMMALPVLFTFMLGTFPAGLVIYWAWNNVLSIAQQWLIMRKMGVPAS